jgi:hypothetical protein
LVILKSEKVVQITLARNKNASKAKCVRRFFPASVVRGVFTQPHAAASGGIASRLPSARLVAAVAEPGSLGGTMHPAMTTRISASQVVLKSLVALLIASPLVGLFGGAIMGRPADLPPSLLSQWLSDAIPTVLGLWCLTVFLYAVGFWFAFVLLQRGILRRRAAALWWCSLVFGLLAALVVPLGTVLALPCLIVLFWRRSVYFQTDDHAA